MENTKAASAVDTAEDFEPGSVPTIEIDGVDYEVVHTIEYDGTNYVALIQSAAAESEEGATEFVVLREEEEDGDFFLASFETAEPELYATIGNLFIEEFQSVAEYDE